MLLKVHGTLHSFSPSLILFYFFWLHQVSVAAHGSFIVVLGMSSCSGSSSWNRF